MRPMVVWMLIAKAPRHEWPMYWTGGHTRKDSATAFAMQFGDAEVGKALLRKRLKEKEIRYARVRIQEVIE